MIVCPKCGKSLPLFDPEKPLVDWVDDFPTEIEVARKIDAMPWLYGTTVTEKCAVCLKKRKALTATKHCRACKEYFCDECGNQHWLLKASKPHRVMLIEDLENLKNDPLLRADLTAIFSAKIKSARLKSPRNGRLSPRANSPRSGLLSPRNLSRENSPISPRGKSPLGNFLFPHSPKMTGSDLDAKDSKIVDITFLYDGCVVLSDEGNHKIKLFDKNYRLLSSIEACCWNLMTLNEYVIAGSCPDDKCVQYFSIYDNTIVLDSVVDMDQPCYGLCKADDNIAVACSGSEPEDATGNLSSAGTIKFLSSQNNTIHSTVELHGGKIKLKTPHNLSYDSQNNKFFISDLDTKCLKCLTKDGELVWERIFNDMTCLKLYRSSILIGRSNQRTVDLLDSKTGQCLKSVVGVQDGLSRVTAFALESQDSDDTPDRLAVTDDTDLVRVFSLMDPSDILQTFAGHKDMTSTKTSEKVKKSKLCKIL